MTRPREWWLHYKTSGYSGWTVVEEVGSRILPQDYPCDFHVIEHSAYKTIQAKLAKAIELLGQDIVPADAIEQIEAIK
jgi:hypothetical protein